MATTLYKEVKYSLKTLADEIELGEIGLPELQRPFVWRNSKVRDLFDSMYRGYPVGFLLFWATTAEPLKSRSIGTNSKQRIPKLLVVDGQQRLTSLYAVIKGIQVVREKGEKECIQIAFCPKTETFEVLDAAVANDPEFINDISKIWREDSGKSRFAKEFVRNLRASRTVSEEQEDQITDAIDRLHNLESFPFLVLELASSVDEEQVSEVFVRINSQGKSLQQADFILTLMSVFWEEGRKNLENFCTDARTPQDEKKSAYNLLLQPGANDLLRVAIGLGFNRGRLKYGYALLRGRDLETGETSIQRRDEQFRVLAEAQSQMLDLSNWHEFLKIVNTAGYLRGEDIGSGVGLLFSYTLYLKGLRDFKLDRDVLRQAIACWLFMSALTRRYTNSPESVIERDLTELSAAKTGKEFLALMNASIDAQLTSDYWTIKLPNELDSSAARSPAFFAYQAALCILDAKALYSKLPLRELFNPYIKAPRTAVEKHHLFPKAFLARSGIKTVRETNKVSNFAWLEWTDNGKISAADPREYVGKMEQRFSKSELKQMYYLHALPADWGSLEFGDFLSQRRSLIALVVKDAFDKLRNLGSKTDF